MRALSSAPLARMLVSCLAFSGVDFVARRDEEFAAVLQVVDGVGERRAALKGNHGAVGASLDVAFVGLIFLEAVRHDGFALTGGEHVGAQSDDAARGDVELDVDAVSAAFHRGELAFAPRHHVDHFAGKFFGYVDGEFFDRFAAHAVYGFVNDLRLPDL